MVYIDVCRTCGCQWRPSALGQSHPRREPAHTPRCSSPFIRTSMRAVPSERPLFHLSASQFAKALSERNTQSLTIAVESGSARVRCGGPRCLPLLCSTHPSIKTYIPITSRHAGAS